MADALPSVGVIKVGLVVKATVLVPLSSLRAAARVADVGFNKNAATPVPRVGTDAGVKVNTPPE